MFEVKDLIDRKVLARIQTDFFEGHEDVIFLAERAEGYWERDGRMRMGCRSGPVLELDATLHEIGHMVEIDDDRCGISGWRLRYGRLIHVPGHDPFHEEFKTAQPIEREIRVLGVQACLHDHYGIPYDALGAATSMAFIDSFWYLHYVDYKPSGTTYRDHEKIAIAVIMNRIEDEKTKHTFEAVHREWTRKMGILRQHLDAQHSST